LYMF